MLLRAWDGVGYECAQVCALVCAQRCVRTCAREGVRGYVPDRAPPHMCVCVCALAGATGLGPRCDGEWAPSHGWMDTHTAGGAAARAWSLSGAPACSPPDTHMQWPDWRGPSTSAAMHRTHVVPGARAHARCRHWGCPALPCGATEWGDTSQALGVAVRVAPAHCCGERG